LYVHISKAQLHFPAITQQNRLLPGRWLSRWRLVFAWQQSPDFLANKMPMASVADSKKVRQLLRDLDDSRYVVRQRATLSLESMAPAVILPLHRTLTDARSLEVRRRVEDILARLKQPALSPENMRASRAVRVLEQIGSPQAKHLLESLAKGGEFAWQTSEAQRALERLAKGHP
jgi:hypothetical protein